MLEHVSDGTKLICNAGDLDATPASPDVWASCNSDRPGCDSAGGCCVLSRSDPTRSGQTVALIVEMQIDVRLLASEGDDETIIPTFVHCVCWCSGGSASFTGSRCEHIITFFHDGGSWAHVGCSAAMVHYLKPEAMQRWWMRRGDDQRALQG